MQTEPPPASERLSETLIDKTFPADFRWVRRIVQETVDVLSQDDTVRPEDVDTIQIIIAEALNNVVEHAYPEDKPGDVNLIVRRRRGALMCEIKDRGRPMPNGRVPVGDHPMHRENGEPMPEGGYGWFLIRELVRDLIYDRKNGENVLFMTFAASGRPGP